MIVGLRHCLSFLQRAIKPTTGAGGRQSKRVFNNDRLLPDQPLVATGKKGSNVPMSAIGSAQRAR